MFIILSIYSKNISSLTNFLKFFYKLSTNKKMKLQIFTSQHSKKKEKVFFSVLKSPHVNKSAQEQFEYNLFKKQIKIDVFQITKLLVILKMIKSKLFSDIEIELKFSVHHKSFQKVVLNKINSDQFILDLAKEKKLFQSNLIGQTFLKLLDIYGEISRKNFDNKKFRITQFKRNRY